jgi:serine/threonine protein kinase
MDELSPGAVFAGRFCIESPLGSGGQGRVYLARHEVLQRQFALKVLDRSLRDDKTAAARFRREARAAARIENAHVVYIHDFGLSEEGQPYLAMEYVPGVSLAGALAEGPLPVPRVLAVLSQIVEALTAAHACDVVHRDLKPSNIMLTTHQGQPDFVKVLDFGLAKIMGQSTQVSTYSTSAGTPHYLSPEQISDAGVDFRCDIYSLGVVAFEMLTGKVPFSGSLMEVLKAHVVRMPPPLARASGRKDIPQPLEGLVQRCLAKSPEDRYANAVSLAAEIQTLQLGLGERPFSNWPSSTVQQARTRSFARKVSDLEQTDPEQRTVPSGRAVTPVAGWKELETEVERGGSRGPILALARWRVLSELAYGLRDRGIGDAGLSEELALLIVAEGRLDEVATAISVLEAEANTVEIHGKMREARLGRLLSQLEHEQGDLAGDHDDLTQTLPLRGGPTKKRDGLGAGGRRAHRARGARRTASDPAIRPAVARAHHRDPGPHRRAGAGRHQPAPRDRADRGAAGREAACGARPVPARRRRARGAVRQRRDRVVVPSRQARSASDARNRHTACACCERGVAATISASCWRSSSGSQRLRSRCWYSPDSSQYT